MFEKFFPDEYVASTYVIPFEKLYEEKQKQSQAAAPANNK